jgi:chromate transport protein ChrA
MATLALAHVIGIVSMAILLFVLARLSQRLGRVNSQRPFYRALDLSALMLLASAVIRAWRILAPPTAQGDPAVLLLADRLVVLLPALALTLGLGTAWYYWSWILAERT